MIYTLTGSNSFARNAYLSELKKSFINDHGKDGLEFYSGEQLTPETLASALGGISLFASHRFVAIRDVAQAKGIIDQLLANLDSVPSEVTIVLIESALDKRTALYKALSKNTDFHEFTELSEPEIVKWIQQEVSLQEGSINTSDARILFEYCGSDQQRLSQEISKLVAYNAKVTADSISGLVEKNPKDTIFELLELAMRGRSNEAMVKLSSLESAHEDPFQIASMLVWQTHILAVVYGAGARSDGEIAKTHKINPYVVSKTKNLTRAMSKQKLGEIVSLVAQLDITLKTNAHDPWRALQSTILNL